MNKIVQMMEYMIQDVVETLRKYKGWNMIRPCMIYIIPRPTTILWIRRQAYTEKALLMCMDCIRMSRILEGLFRQRYEKTGALLKIEGFDQALNTFCIPDKNEHHCSL